MGKWLVKTEPENYSIGDLKRERRTVWEGVRNALAQIHLKGMEKGDLVLVYHSGKEKAVTGLAKVAKAAYADPTDEKGKAMCVDLTFEGLLDRPVTLTHIKGEPSLKEIPLLRISRLSVMPLTEDQYQKIMLIGECRRPD